ncbi:MAG: 6,7-dimethyl-8-ribityllumazine synthase [Sphingobacteriales bacterium]|nr:MAG: 6,7-dimethyl-8-ribityllumazine synthase [Sphingobacteriales bacterium]
MASKLKNLSDFSHTTIPNAAPFKFGIVVASWNVQVTGALYKGAYNALLKHNTSESNIVSIEVAGSYELVAATDLLLQSQFYDAVICLGCVIQGETKHFDFICNAVASGLVNVGLKYTKPVVFGVLTTDNLQQALDRAGGIHGNKGEEAAITAIKMAYVANSLKN